MINGGYYIKARCIQSSEVAYAAPVVRELWDWLLMNANHTDSKYKGFLVKRGQLFRSYNDLIEGLSWRVGWRKMSYNENQMKKAMKFLREHLMITSKKELGGVLITILNYDYYQDPNNYESYYERTNEGTIEGTIGELRKNQPIPYNNKKKKNVKNVKKGIYGEFQNVHLTDEEVEKLKAKLNSHFQEYIENLSTYKQSKGKSYKDDYATILNWSRKDDKESTNKNIGNRTQRKNPLWENAE